MLNGEQWSQLLLGFIEEARDLGKQAEEYLLQLDQQPDDAAAINGLFRAMHTLKGSAGLFSLTPLVSFTHHLENLLMAVRDGHRALDPSLVSLMLRCLDEIVSMIALIDPETGELPVDEQHQTELLGELAAHLGAAAPAHAAPAEATPPAEAGSARDGAWHISLRFHADLLRNGFDPIAFVQYLGRLGEVLHLQVIDDALPPLAELDPESCYLGMEIDLLSNATKAEIEDVFDFIHDFCTLRILPPDSALDDYIRLIQALPETDQRIGAILVASGLLTEHELAQGLALQAGAAELAGPGRGAGGRRHRRPAGGQRRPGQAEELARAQGPGKQPDPRRRAQARRADQPGRRAGHQRRRGPVAGADARQRPVPGRRADGQPARRADPRGGAEAAHDRDRRHLQPLPPRGARRQPATGQGHPPGDPRCRDRAGQVGDRQARRSLTHLVRNAIDHGIESAEQRLAAGKSAEGRLSLNAFHESGMIVIEVADDGHGLNTARIREKAIARGLIDAQANLPEHDIQRLIFAAGFSTADNVSDLSGRGVGMDVVRSAIDALRGSIEIDSRPGLGCTFRIRLPLTLAIIDGFLVSLGEEHFVVPLDMVTECLELEDGQLAEAAYGYLDLRGRPLPCIDLAAHFELPVQRGKRRNIVVVSLGRQQAGLVVDNLHGELQTVIKPLGLLFQHLEGISGSTILGSGQVALILDIASLFRHLQGRVDADARTLSTQPRPDLAGS